MPSYTHLGELPKKRHTQYKRHKEDSFLQEGLYYEHVITVKGFDRAYSVLYHLRPPTRIKHIETIEQLDLSSTENSIRPHHLRSQNLSAQGDPISGRVPFTFNEDVIISRAKPSQQQDTLYRNAAATEIIFFAKGQGIMESPFGKVPYKTNDYLVIPQGITYRLISDNINAEDQLIIESLEHVELPKRYINPDGQLKLGAPYYERDFHSPQELITLDEEKDTDILVKENQLLSKITYAHHPFDVIAWDGFVYPYTFNALDFEALTGTIHLPPPFQQTFETPGFVICNFVPRHLDHHPDAIKIPYAHSNVMMDEMLFYASGDFGSRKGIDAGSITLHPRALTHGPHPGTIKASEASNYTNELAVMVDTVKKLQLTPQAMAHDVADYSLSWLE